MIEVKCDDCAVTMPTWTLNPAATGNFLRLVIKKRKYTVSLFPQGNNDNPNKPRVHLCAGCLGKRLVSSVGGLK